MSDLEREGGEYLRVRVRTGIACVHAGILVAWMRACARLRACLDFTVPTCPVCPDDLSMFATAWLMDECGIYLT